MTPVIPPLGETDKVTDGIERYPAPLFDIAKLLTPPSLGVPAIAVAVTPTPTIVRVWVGPIIVEILSSVSPSDSPPIKTSSISSLPVSITSSSYLKSSQVSS